jgi:hypothetical protein
MSIRYLALVALALAGATLLALQVSPRGHSRSASPDSYLCVGGTTQDVEGNRITTPTVCIPWI